MKLYNSETRQIEEIVPHSKDVLTLYTCGPTVYHYAHIGNLRSYIMEDVLEKSLRFVGFNVKRAMNITDVGHLSSDGDTGEDKMLLGAEREHKTVLEIAKKFTDAFKTDCERLNLKWPEIVVPATACVDEYIKIIEKLMATGYAYKSGGNVYFDTSKLKEYYRFGNQGKDDLIVGAREGVDEDLEKRNKNDFVLWFTKSKFENHALKWESPWGTGYPGWHIECSGISMKYLGEHLDIHCGGVDNKFPHHTNEIAQSESFLGHKWCGHWFHVEHLNTKSGKMSKSSGEFLTLSRLEEMGYFPMIYKYFCLSSHYRKILVFSTEALDSAKSAYEKIVRRINEIKEDGNISKEQASPYLEQFKAALENDLNTSLALTALYDVLKSELNGATKCYAIGEMDKVLGLDLLTAQVVQEAGNDLNDEFRAFIEQKIEERKTAKASKDYALADKIREELKARGVELVDTKDGTTYKIV
ncbi:MAG: cysteine--tRNA ligase [Clostridia bacterium]|nr:cysteine--tRNA ligase [Clostridia bacterium]